ncbi:phage tail protein [Streptobacillus moniliformis]|uniref:phage tail-collar fiber domain-containing protein n=1 Tax=Streptobacillus moniliformis TaxID=34105 RepID=UPI0007E3D3F3|nr:phage tail protein [Streptobacillus moniliformis]
MSNYLGWILTNEGRNLLGRAIAHETKINFTKFKIGSGFNNGDDKTLTELIDFKNEFPVNSYTTKNDGIVEFIFVVSNRDKSGSSIINEGFKIKEMGIFAQDDTGKEIMYAYNKGDEGDYLPAYNGKNAIDIVQKCIIIVDQQADLNIKIDSSLTYLTVEEFENYKKSLKFATFEEIWQEV